MSKSLGNAIQLRESPDEIWQKLRVAVTDPARVRRQDPGNPDVCNIYSLHKCFSAPTVIELVNRECRTAGIGCIDCKRMLNEAMVAALAPIRARAAELSARPSEVTEILAAGAATARAVARATMEEVRERVGVRPRTRVSA